MLTVADALQLEQFTGAMVVAGADGLDRAIAWVHIASVPDAPRFLNGGELVLTTGHNLPNEPEERREYVTAMAEKGVVGLVLSVGRYLDSVPDDLRTLADRHHFPLIEIPYQARFIDIAKSTNERIAAENMVMVTGALNIQQVLTQLVLEGGDLKQLASRLAGLLGQSVSIENERFEILASANVAEVDEARRFTVSEGHTNPRLVQALEERGILSALRQTRRPVQIPIIPEVGLELERILAPIVVHSDIYGYMWIIAHGRPLTELDRMALNTGATVAALMMLYQESVQSAEASLKGSLLSQLIQGEQSREAVLADQALRYGVDLSARYRLMVMDAAGAVSGRSLQLYRRINRLAGMQEWRAVVGQFAGQVLVLTQADQNLSQMIEQIRAESGGLEVRMGISGVQRGVELMGAAHRQCREVLHITRRLKDPRPAVYFDDLGYLHALYLAGEASLTANLYVPAVRRLLEAGERELFNTLEAYLDAGGNGVQTAENLHIHRSTLNYRLSRLVELHIPDLSDPLVRMNLQVALKLLRLFGLE
jgi:purine catabolism regulator